MGLSTRTLTLLQDRLLFLLLQQNLQHGPTQVAAILEQKAAHQKLAQSEGTGHRHAWATQILYGKDGTIDGKEHKKWDRVSNCAELATAFSIEYNNEKAKPGSEWCPSYSQFQGENVCNAPKKLWATIKEHEDRSGDGSRWACWAVPGEERFTRNVYDTNYQSTWVATESGGGGFTWATPPGQGITEAPAPRFWGSADTNSVASYTSCCTVGPEHNEFLKQEETLREAKKWVTANANVVSVQLAIDLLNLYPGVLMKKEDFRKQTRAALVAAFGEKQGTDSSDVHSLSHDGGLELLTRNEERFGEITGAAYQFLSDFKDGHFHQTFDRSKSTLEKAKTNPEDVYLTSEDYGYGGDPNPDALPLYTGKALQRLLDGAIYERRLAIKALHVGNMPDDKLEGKSSSKWVAPDVHDSRVVKIGELGKNELQYIGLNDDKYSGIYNDQTKSFEKFPWSLPAIVGDTPVAERDTPRIPLKDANTGQSLTLDIKLQDADGQLVPSQIPVYMPEFAYQTIAPPKKLPGEDEAESFLEKTKLPEHLQHERGPRVRSLRGQGAAVPGGEAADQQQASDLTPLTKQESFVQGGTGNAYSGPAAEFALPQAVGTGETERR